MTMQYSHQGTQVKKTANQSGKGGNRIKDLCVNTKTNTKSGNFYHEKVRTGKQETGEIWLFLGHCNIHQVDIFISTHPITFFT